MMYVLLPKLSRAIGPAPPVSLRELLSFSALRNDGRCWRRTPDRGLLPRQVDAGRIALCPCDVVTITRVRELTASLRLIAPWQERDHRALRLHFAPPGLHFPQSRRLVHVEK